MQGDMKNLTKRQVTVQIAEETGLTQQEVLVVIQKTLNFASLACSTCASVARGWVVTRTSLMKSW